MEKAGWNEQHNVFVLAKVGAQYFYRDGEKIPSQDKCTLFEFIFSNESISVRLNHAQLIIEGCKDVQSLMQELSKNRQFSSTFSSTVFQLLICAELADGFKK